MHKNTANQEPVPGNRVSHDKTKRNSGIYVLGILLLLASFFWLISPYVLFANYSKSFHYLPEKIIMLRYSWSILIRVTGVVCGIGILYHKDIFRRIAILLCCSTIVTIYWKHPQIVFNEATSKVMHSLGAKSIGIMSAQNLANVSMVIVSSGDVFFAVLFIWYFSQPHIKNQFS